MKYLSSIVLIAACLASACSPNSSESDIDSESPTDNVGEGAKCVVGNQMYRFKFKELSGDCGKLTSTIRYVDENGVVSEGSNCSTQNRYDGCHVKLFTSCTNVNGTSVNTQKIGDFTWDENSKTGKGKIEFRKTGAENCFSTYEMTASRY